MNEQLLPKRPSALSNVRPEPPKFASVAEEREHRKRIAVAAFRLFGKYGFEEGAMGHISFRDPEYPDTFWLNPFAISFDTILPGDLMRLSLDGEVLEGDGFRHPGGYPLHSAILKANPAAVAAVHTHAPYSRAWSALGRLIDPVCNEAAWFYGRHALYDTYADGEGEKLAKLLGQNRALILNNHGVVTIGQSVDEAAYWFLALEKVCQIQLLAEAAGTVRLINAERATQSAARIGPEFGWLNFQPYYQSITAAHPDLLG